MSFYTFEPTQTKIWRDRTPDGKPKLAQEQPCDCPGQIPGLTSTFCKIHRTYWVDRFLELQIKDNKKSFGSSFDINETDEGRKQRSTPESSCATSAEIWGQEGGLEGDPVAIDPQEPSKGKNQGLRTIIAGSRSVQSLEVVEQAIAHSGFQISEVVSGTANGPDKLGEQWAAKHSIPVKQFPADWDTHGKKAGYFRNSEMAQYAEAAIAIWDGQSKGTAHMIAEAKKHGLKVFVYRTDSQEIEEPAELIRVVNIKRIKGQKLPNLIVAMQSKGHPLGNPYYKEASRDRAGCVAKFKKHLWRDYQIEGSAVREAVEAIADLVLQGEQVNLACVCKQPDVFVACHCDEIKALIENFVIPRRLEVAA